MRNSAFENVNGRIVRAYRLTLQRWSSALEENERVVDATGLEIIEGLGASTKVETVIYGGRSTLNLQDSPFHGTGRVEEITIVHGRAFEERESLLRRWEVDDGPDETTGNGFNVNISEAFESSTRRAVGKACGC